MITRTIDRNFANMRLDRFLRKAFPEESLSVFFAIIRKKKVRVNGVVGKANQMLVEGDVVNIYENFKSVSESDERNIKGESLPLASAAEAAPATPSSGDTPPKGGHAHISAEALSGQRPQRPVMLSRNLSPRARSANGLRTARGEIHIRGIRLLPGSQHDGRPQHSSDYGPTPSVPSG